MLAMLTVSKVSNSKCGCAMYANVGEVFPTSTLDWFSLQAKMDRSRTDKWIHFLNQHLGMKFRIFRICWKLQQ